MPDMIMDASSSKPGKRVPRVLVVDDEAITRSLVAKKIAALGITAIEAEDGRVAWNLLQLDGFDLVVVDLEMPELDGFELISRMRARARTQTIPVVVLTSKEDSASVDRALRCGAVTYLRKPLNWPLFGEHIARLCGLGAP